MNREMLLKWWDEAWTSGLWAASWERSIDGLSAAEAEWKPAPQRHSIRQLVDHLVFWREVTLRRIRTAAGPDDAEIALRNFPEPAAAPSEAAWAAATRRLRESQEQVRAAMADPSIAEGSAGWERFRYLIVHDAYHFGQINYLRAMLGKPPIE